MDRNVPHSWVPISPSNGEELRFRMPLDWTFCKLLDICIFSATASKTLTHSSIHSPFSRTLPIYPSIAVNTSSLEWSHFETQPAAAAPPQPPTQTMAAAEAAAAVVVESKSA